MAVMRTRDHRQRRQIRISIGHGSAGETGGRLRGGRLVDEVVAVVGLEDAGYRRGAGADGHRTARAARAVWVALQLMLDHAQHEVLRERTDNSQLTEYTELTRMIFLIP